MRQQKQLQNIKKHSAIAKLYSENIKSNPVWQDWVRVDFVGCNGVMECKSVIMVEIQCKYNPEIQTHFCIYPVTCLRITWWFKNGPFLLWQKSNTVWGCTWMTLITDCTDVGAGVNHNLFITTRAFVAVVCQRYMQADSCQDTAALFSHCCQSANSSRITRLGLGSDCKSDLPCISLPLSLAFFLALYLYPYLFPTHTRA